MEAGLAPGCGRLADAVVEPEVGAGELSVPECIRSGVVQMVCNQKGKPLVGEDPAE